MMNEEVASAVVEFYAGDTPAERRAHLDHVLTE
jgi:hypothetical protein